jgi:branched-subunit amino acid aminotransferase/4-amino-4-deoxychorismate lyase
VYGGKPFRLAEHLDRLDASCSRLGVELPSRGMVEELVGLALRAAGEREAVLRIYATPGHGDGPVALAMVAELPADLEELRATGIRAITVEFRPADLIGGVKSTSYALNMMAVDEARARGAEDAVFVAGDGTVLEATTSNVWWRRGRALFTPAVDGRILAGVTRDVLSELVSAAGHEIVEGAFPVSELAAADEAFASSSIREVMPIVALDGRAIGDGKPGETAARLQTALRELACR